MLKKYSFRFLMIVLSAFVFQSCKSLAPTETREEMVTINNIIPKPVSAVPSAGNFILKKGAVIYFAPADAEILKIGQHLADRLNPATGFNTTVRSGSNIEPGNIYLSAAGEASLGEEGYELIISDSIIKLTAFKPAGLFRGIQTIKQLFPPGIDSKSVQNAEWIIPAGIINDQPRFEWRGTMLDVSRHFFGVEDVKNYIDLLAYYKINRFHMHLSDDQGWRIEIKSWPKLTEIGGSTAVGGGEGGFYTQQQYSEIVKYAAERYITVVPEIDMPGHTNAALASYAELNCSDTAQALYTGIDVGFSSLCIDKEITYKFIDDVVREISALTPGAYFHIGGDEALSTDSLEYIKFIERVQDIVGKYGKQMVGWEEISQSKLKTTSIAQLWKNKLVLNAVNQGVKVILSPSPKIYLDMKYDSSTELGLNWAGYVEVKDAYDWEPVEYVEGITEKDVLGIEAPLWAETIVTSDDIEFLAFPRLIGVAEIGWTQKNLRNWDDYKLRLGNHSKRLKNLEVNFYQSPQVNWR